MGVIIGLVLSAAIGLSLGLIGGGGSIITVPVLVYVMGVEAHQAVGMSLAVVGATSLAGALLHYRQGVVNVKTGALFAGAGILAAYFGSRLTHLLSPPALMLTFGFLMLVVAVLMLARKQPDHTVRHPLSLWKALSAGAVVGVLTGFLGVGGGFLIVPALVLFGNLAIKDAIGTSLMVIALNCAAGLLGHMQQSSFDIRLTLLVSALATAGAVGGVFLSHRLHPSNLQKGFAVFVLCVAFFLIAKNYTVMSQSLFNPGQ